METRSYTKKIADLVRSEEAGEECPLPVSVIPNYMGINLCSVDSVSWVERGDGQLVSLTIQFIPADAAAPTDPSGPDDGPWGVWVEPEAPGNGRPHWVGSDGEPFVTTRAAAEEEAAKLQRWMEGRSSYTAKPYVHGESP